TPDQRARKHLERCERAIWHGTIDNREKYRDDDRPAARADDRARRDLIERKVNDQSGASRDDETSECDEGHDPLPHEITLLGTKDLVEGKFHSRKQRRRAPNQSDNCDNSEN